MIVNFDPTNEAAMRALCKQWTEGGPAVFAVLDGIGTWTGDNQLCITQEGHTPCISQWTTVTNWTQKGSPYLWWTGPDDAAILQATVDWGLSRGRLGHGVKVGVIAGDRASDQLALDQYLLPDLQRAGITPVVETIAADPSDSATTDSAGAPGRPAAARRRCHLGDPAHPVQRLLPGPAGRDPAAVLPHAPVVGLRGLDRIGARASRPPPATSAISALAFRHYDRVTRNATATFSISRT